MAMIYMLSATLLAACSFSSFVRIVHRHCPGVRKAHLKTDYCDQCQLYQATLPPRCLDILPASRAMLQGCCPFIFEEWDTKPRMQALQHEDPVRYCRLYRDYLDAFIDRHRQRLREQKIKIGDLADDITGVKNDLLEHLEVLRAYRWHRRTHVSHK